MGKVIEDIPKDMVSEVIVVNNASTDRTEVVAHAMGATVLKEPNRGYGRACLKGIDYLKKSETKTDIVVFPELAVSGYLKEDILTLSHDILENALSKIIN